MITPRHEAYISWQVIRVLGDVDCITLSCYRVEWVYQGYETTVMDSGDGIYNTNVNREDLMAV